MNEAALEDTDASAPIKVLVCEHSGIQRRILTEILEQEGLACSSVATSDEALEKFRAAQFDLFITGVEVGDVTGVELCWHLKSSPATAHVYNIVVTASGNRQRVVEALDSGADDFVRKPFDEVELRARFRSALRIVRMQLKLKELADTDPLTGAANRRSFVRALDAEISRAERYGVPLSIAMVDLDHFKRINDNYGHAVGDEVLVTSVGVMRDCLRSQDIVGRLGGEEFCILLPHTETSGAVDAADKVRRAIADMKIETEKGLLQVSASFGVARFSAPMETADVLLQAADSALYTAKNGGRNQVQLAAA